MESAQTANNKQFDLMAGIQWFLAGFMLMLASTKFYKDATKKQPGSPRFSFMLFMLVLTALSSMNILFLVNEGKTAIEQAYLEKSVPVITISNGIANSSGPPVYTYLDEEGTLLRVDVTGNRAEIDRTQYYQGFLLTQTELHVLNEGQYEILPLTELQTAFEEDPIVIDDKLVVEMINYATSIGMIIFFIIAVLWNCLIRFLYMVGLGLLIWSFTSLLNKEMGFNTILILGSYAYMAGMLYTFVANQIGVEFIFLHTIIMLAIWILHIYLILQPNQLEELLTPEQIEEKEKPNLLLAFGGIPFLITAVLSYFNPTDGMTIALVTTFLIAVGGILFFESQQTVQIV